MVQKRPGIFSPCNDDKSKKERHVGKRLDLFKN